MYKVCSAIFFSLLLLLSGCARKCPDCSYGAWVGVNLQTVKNHWGKPNRIILLRNGCTMYGYIIRVDPSYGPSMYNYTPSVSPKHVVMGVPDYRNHELTCTTWFKVNNSLDTVIEETTSGSHCEGDADFMKPIGLRIVRY